ncbi:MAG: 30S ribosomal protein S3, partial [Nanoarchaeota archaeon]
MIEKQIVKKNMKEYLIQSLIAEYLPRGSYSKIDLKKTPLGEKIIVHTSRPGLVVGRKGANISELTNILKTKFNMENPQVEVAEITEPNLDPVSVAERIVSSFERFGPKPFKSIGYRALQSIMDAGAQGAEIVISGRGVPGSRAKSWRFSAGHLKKSGDISENYMKRDYRVANLKSGSVGVKVSILTPDVVLPDIIKIKKENLGTPKVEEVKEKAEEVKEKQEAKES